MAIPTPTERITRLERLADVLATRVDSLDSKFVGAASRLDEMDARLHQIDRRLTVVEEILTRQEKKLDDYLDRRWDVAKILLTAAIAAAVGALMRGLPVR